MQQPNTPPNPTGAELYTYALGLRAHARKNVFVAHKHLQMEICRAVISQIEKAVKDMEVQKFALGFASNCSPRNDVKNIVKNRELKAGFDAYLLICELKAIFKHCELVQNEKGENKLFLGGLKAYFDIKPQAVEFVTACLNEKATIETICKNDEVLKAFCCSEISKFYTVFNPAEAPEKHPLGIVVTVIKAQPELNIKRTICIYDIKAHAIIEDKNLKFRPYSDYLV